MQFFVDSNKIYQESKRRFLIYNHITRIIFASIFLFVRFSVDTLKCNISAHSSCVTPFARNQNNEVSLSLRFANSNIDSSSGFVRSGKCNILYLLRIATPFDLPSLRFLFLVTLAFVIAYDLQNLIDLFRT